MLFMFLIFCRTRPLIGQIINATLLNSLGAMVGLYHPDKVYFGLANAYGIPSSVFYFTQNIPLTILTSILQISIVLPSFKQNLIEAIGNTDSDVFAEKFTRSFITITIPFQILYLVVVYTLNKKTDELSRATIKAEEALEQQKIFLYSFSHEMRNPMNSLLGNLDLVMMSQQITPDLKEMINTAKICGVLLLNLINTVLDAGKLGIGKLEVNPVSTKVHDVFQKIWGISHEMISRKDLHSHLKISRQVPPRLTLDGHRLSQVLMNLIGNSIKFTEKGSIVVSVSWIPSPEITEKCFQPIPYDDEDEGLFEKQYNMYAIRRRKGLDRDRTQSLILAGGVKEFGLEGVSQPAAESKGILKIIVRDTGCGMAKEELSKLFQKFSQVGQVTTKRQMGTGLGLYISKEIIENMKGQIRAYSKPRIGSTFIICIPTAAEPLQPQAELQMSVNDHLIPRLRSKRFTTIIADDSSFNVSLVSNFYLKLGVKVLATASNGQLAYENYLEMVRLKRKIDIITLDIDMPIMNGNEVCEKIRQYEQKNNLRRSFVILISGNYEEKDMYNLLKKDSEMGADCFLRKPLVFEELCWMLYKYEQSLGNAQE